MEFNIIQKCKSFFGSTQTDVPQLDEHQSNQRTSAEIITQLLERAQSLVTSDRYDVGNRTLQTEEFGEVAIKCLYGSAAITAMIDGARTRIEIKSCHGSSAIQSYKINPAGSEKPAHEEINLPFERIVELLDVAAVYARQEGKLKHMRIAALLEVPGLPEETAVAWGSETALNMIRQGVKSVKAIKFEEAAFQLNEAKKDLKIMSKLLAEAPAPTKVSREEFDSTVTILHETCAELVQPRRTADFINRMVLKVEEAITIVEEKVKSTLPHRRVLVPTGLPSLT